ncbi:MAG: hypothetical protein RMK57_08300 [Bryobacterales bacterium]|nr:hypothetical protein [Bryobacteraceae bacterium]MDW8354516.1 hypothetical protein [Bryobacterales bacterium]
MAVYLAGTTPPAYVDSGVAIVTAADLKRPEIHPLLFADIERYLKGAVK